MRNSLSILKAKAANGLFVCVGLDPDYSKIPLYIKDKHLDEVGAIVEFLKGIIDATCNVVSAYKPNLAFFEQYGWKGMQALEEEIIPYMESVAPDVLRIGDGKRGDIGNTNDAYFKALFNVMKFDAATISPYLGGKANEPFFVDPNKLLFVLAQTSNQGAEEFQGVYVLPFNPNEKQKVQPFATGGEHALLDNIKEKSMPLYEYVSSKAVSWSDNIGLVTGAPYPGQIADIRKKIGNDKWLLIPGIGAQQAQIEPALKAGFNDDTSGIIINVSRSVLYASPDIDYKEAAREEVVRLNNIISVCRGNLVDVD